MPDALKSSHLDGEGLSYRRQAAARPGEPTFAELSRVELLADVASDTGRSIPAGSVGTIVGIWGADDAFEVEFIEPIAALATVTADHLRGVEP